MEIEHIMEAIESLDCIPDFGFELHVEDKEIFGWNKIWDHCSNRSKYERFNNFLDARLFFLEKEQN